jgi:hypothetical protein
MDFPRILAALNSLNGLNDLNRLSPSLLEFRFQLLDQLGEL